MQRMTKVDAYEGNQDVTIPDEYQPVNAEVWVSQSDNSVILVIALNRRENIRRSLNMFTGDFLSELEAAPVESWKTL